MMEFFGVIALFSIVAGLWILEDAEKHKMPKAWALSPLIAGPFMVVVYLIVRQTKEMKNEH